MFLRHRVLASRLRTLTLAVVLLPLPIDVHAAGPDYTGRYECTDVFEGELTVTMTFSVSVVSHRSEEIVGAKLSLLDATDPAVVYAEFPALSFVAGVDVSLTMPVSLERPEWDRWRSGASPRVRLEAYASDGTDLSAMVDLVRVSSPEVVR